MCHCTNAQTAVTISSWVSLNKNDLGAKNPFKRFFGTSYAQRFHDPNPTGRPPVVSPPVYAIHQRWTTTVRPRPRRVQFFRRRRTARILFGQSAQSRETHAPIKNHSGQYRARYYWPDRGPNRFTRIRPECRRRYRFLPAGKETPAAFSWSRIC